MWLARFKRNPQWLARTKQMLLADDVVKRLGAEPFGEGDGGHVARQCTPFFLFSGRAAPAIFAASGLLFKYVGTLGHDKLELLRSHRRIFLEFLERQHGHLAK